MSLLKATFIAIILLLLAIPSVRAEDREDCFSCEIKVKSLRRPLELRGKWLFTREDLPENKDPDIATRHWVLVDTPGPWSKAYNDGEYFEVGWYRGTFLFDPKLVGKKAVFYVDAYMSRMQIFRDGEEIMRREGQHTHERYYSIQPVPVVFTITKPQQVITLRIDTRLMTGIYQLPFQLRPYKDFDPTLSFYQLYGGEVRNIAAYVLLVFGFFFLLVYTRTRYSLYLVAGLTGIGIFPLYAFPHDNLIRLFPVENLWILHYIGISCMALGHVSYSQYFYKPSPRINRVNYIVVALLAGLFVAMTFRFNMLVFQIIRKLTFFYSFAMAVHLLWNCLNALLHNRRLLVLFLGELFFFFCCTHDILLALGFIKSTSMIFIGTLVATSSILYLTAIIFAETFMQNRQLLLHVEQVNQNLEQTVALRTNDLYEKKQNLSLILQSLPEGILTFEPGFQVLAEYSMALENILETQHIEGRDVFQLLFGNSNVSTDVLAQMRNSLEFSFGETDLNFEANRQLLLKEFHTIIRGHSKVLALGWSAVLAENGTVSRVLLTVSDVTQVKRLERESQLARLRTKIVEGLMDGSIQRIQDFVGAALSSINPFIQSLKAGQLDEEQLVALHREVHTIKGNALTFDLIDLAENAHQAESALTELKRRSETMESEQVQFILQDLLESLAQIESIKQDMLTRLNRQENRDLQGVNPKLWRMFRKRWQHLSVEHLQDALPDLQADIQMMSYRQAKPYFISLVHGFDEVAKGLGKPSPIIHLDIADDFFMDPNLARATHDILMHMIRNSLDHGIEAPEQRRLANKTERGQILIQFRPQTKGFILDYVDDGRGMDLEKIREKAASMGMKEGQATQPEHIVHAIFMRGFTTTDQVSDVSGRGVGLEIVANELRQWKAKLRWNQMSQLAPGGSLLPFDISILFPSHAIQVSEAKTEVRIAL